MSASLEIIAHARAHTDSFSLECVVINRSKTGLDGSAAHERVPFSYAVRLRPALGASPAARTTAGTADVFGDTFMVHPHCASRRSTLHEKQSSRCLHPLVLEDWMWCHWMEKVVAIMQTGDKEGSRVSVFLPPVPDRMHKSVSVPQSPRRNSLYEARHCGPSIDRAMNVRPSTNASRAGSDVRTRASSATRKAVFWHPVIWRYLVEREN